jgi:protein-tyrosine-phosphatase
MVEHQLLFVCTANICRSPAAEAIARSHFGDSSFTYRSAGFLEAGRPIEPDMAKALQRIDVEPGDHRSAVIDSALIEASSVILTMEARHIQNIVIDHPAALAKMLPLREAAELIESRRIRGLAQLLDALEGRDPMRYLERRWDVEDPYKRGRRHYRRSATEIASLVDTVVGALR